MITESSQNSVRHGFLPLLTAFLSLYLQFLQIVLRLCVGYLNNTVSAIWGEVTIWNSVVNYSKCLLSFHEFNGDSTSRPHSAPKLPLLPVISKSQALYCKSADKVSPCLQFYVSCKILLWGRSWPNAAKKQRHCEFKCLALITSHNHHHNHRKQRDLTSLHSENEAVFQGAFHKTVGGDGFSYT